MCLSSFLSCNLSCHKVKSVGSMTSFEIWHAGWLEDERILWEKINLKEKPALMTTQASTVFPFLWPDQNSVFVLPSWFMVSYIVLVSSIFWSSLDRLKALSQQALWIAGGDGTSYNNLLLLWEHLQDHTEVFQQFELMEPLLLAYHVDRSVSDLFYSLGYFVEPQSCYCRQQCEDNRHLWT